MAAASIREGLARHRPCRPNPDAFPSPLLTHLASFVTLENRGQLRGCIGHLTASQSLVRDVAENAYAAAFRDPRFPPLQQEEYAGLDLHISVLSVPEPLCFESEADLIAQIRPVEDGLILEEGHHQGTFLPSVWAQLPRVEDFWQHLKRKAGLPMGYWSKSLRVFRYTTESFGGPISAG